MASKALLLLCTIAIAGCCCVAADPPNPKRPSTITLLLAYKDGDRVGTPGYSDTVTSYRTWAGAAYDFKTLKSVGFVDGMTTVLKVRPTYKVFLSNFVYDFGSAVITTMGDTVTDKALNVVAITGGTGKYKGAYGEVVVTDLPTPYKFADSVAEYKVVLKVYV